MSRDRRDDADCRGASSDRRWQIEDDSDEAMARSKAKGSGKWDSVIERWEWADKVSGTANRMDGAADTKLSDGGFPKYVADSIERYHAKGNALIETSG